MRVFLHYSFKIGRSGDDDDLVLLNTALAAGPSIGRSAVMARSADAPHEDCLECRMIGTGAMLGISGYFVYLSRGLKSSTQGDRRFSAAMSVCFAMAGAYRWFM